jgi:hypothetical protein
VVLPPCKHSQNHSAGPVGDAVRLAATPPVSPSFAVVVPTRVSAANRAAGTPDRLHCSAPANPRAKDSARQDSAATMGFARSCSHPMLARKERESTRPQEQTATLVSRARNPMMLPARLQVKRAASPQSCTTGAVAQAFRPEALSMARSCRGSPFGPRSLHVNAHYTRYTRSKIPAAPIPPPMHMVTMPYRPFLRSKSRSKVAVSFAPVQPSGCPSAIAPPFGLMRDASSPAC